MRRRQNRITAAQLRATMAAYEPITRPPTVSTAPSDVADVGPHDQLLLPIESEEQPNARKS